jgi:hypothetical protein
MMTTRQRLDLLARAYPRLFPRAESLRLLKEQLGHVDALDDWIARGGVQVRARAPKLIYHICAGNLAISAITSIGHGLLLGAMNEVKLPSDREDAATRREILDFVRGLPVALRKWVSCHAMPDDTVLRQADAVIAFGGDDAMASIRAQVRWDQKFLAHGHAVSLLWLNDPDGLTMREARACAVDILTYDQLGCLSPQAIYLAPGADLDALGSKLARALEGEFTRGHIKPRRPLAVAARIAEARDVAFALGHRTWLPPKRHLGWTIIHDPNPDFTASPLHGVIYLRVVKAERLPHHLAAVRGRISTVGFVAKSVAGKSSSRWREAFLSLGVSRFCPAGRMQFPPLTWHHDGRGTLADLVTWIDLEGTQR